MFPFMIWAQNSKYSGVYSYSTPLSSSHYHEEISLKNDGSFYYKQSMPFYRVKIIGNWQVSNGYLVLDSHPQRSKMLVKESWHKQDGNVIQVRDKSENCIGYYLYLITNKKDTLIYRDQFNKSIISRMFSSFYIVDTKGLHSPVYNVIGGRTNYFEVKFETKRLFENEYWMISKEGLIPIGLDNKPQSYLLKRKSLRK